MTNSRCPGRFILIGVDCKGNENARLEYECDPTNSFKEELQSFRVAFHKAFNSSHRVFFQDVAITEDN